MLKINQVTVERLFKKREMGESFIDTNVKSRKMCEERNLK